MKSVQSMSVPIELPFPFSWRSSSTAERFRWDIARIGQAQGRAVLTIVLWLGASIYAFLGFDGPEPALDHPVVKIGPGELNALLRGERKRPLPSERPEWKITLLCQWKWYL